MPYYNVIVKANDGTFRKYRKVNELKNLVRYLNSHRGFKWDYINCYEIVGGSHSSVTRYSHRIYP